MEEKMLRKIIGSVVIAGSLLGFSAPIVLAQNEDALIKACKDGGGTWNPADHTCAYPKK
jgi:hypothetical protein